MRSEPLLDRFHPAIRRVKEIVDSGELGTPTKIEATLALPSGFVKDNDIRMVYDLGGGAMMDLGCASDCNLPRGSRYHPPQATHCPFRGI
jgi:hypothetical protein